jgi:hypothetical protein
MKNEHECYICMEKGDTVESPCACRTHAHAACLARWIAERKTTLCPVCRRDYRAYVKKRIDELSVGVSAPIIDDDDETPVEIVVIEDTEPDEDTIPELNETLRRQRRRLDDSRPSATTSGHTAEQPDSNEVRAFYPVVEPFQSFRPPRQQIPSRATSPGRPTAQQAQTAQTETPPPQPPQQQPSRRRRWKERVRRFFGMDEDRPRSIVRAVVVVVVITVCFIGFVIPIVANFLSDVENH